MATTATVRSNQKDNQNSTQTPALDLQPAHSGRKSHARNSAGEKFISFAVVVTGCGLLGATIGSGRSTLIGVAVGMILGLVFSRIK